MSQRRTAIMIATHKQYDFPNDAGYIPVHVGKEQSASDLGIQGDHDGDNISSLNPYFCELTGLYWLWKNVEADYYGLVHYRRYFKPVCSDQETLVKEINVASSESLVSMLGNSDILLSRQRNYWIESVESHYKNAHHRADLQNLRDTILSLHPDYAQSFEHVMKGTKISLYNMFVMNSHRFNQYASWLFPILFALQEQVPYKDYGPYQRRVFGFLAERLLNIWVLQNIPIEHVKYLPVVNLEGENLLVKAQGLLKRKFSDTRLA